MVEERGWKPILDLYSRTYRLSGRESHLLAGAVEGVHDKWIADEWGCSRATVATYWKRIFAKTGVRPQRNVLAHVLRFAGGAQDGRPSTEL